MNSDQNVVYLHLDDIIPNRFQPREVFDERALKELAISIKEHGVIQPIIVRAINNGKYEIIAGERRYKASALAGLTTIPAIVRNLDDKEAAKVALLENLQRKNLNPVEEARTYQKIIELDDMTQDALAKTMGKSQSAVANKLRLLSLPDEVLDSLLKEEISERHARSLLNLNGSEEQIKMLNRIKNEKMTVKALEEEIKNINMQNNETIVNNNDLNNLINPQPVNIIEEQPAVKDTSFLMNPAGNINNANDEIVNYGEIKNDTEEPSVEVEENEPLNINPGLMTNIDLDKLKEQSSDIGDITKSQDIQENNNTLDSLLNIQAPIENTTFNPAEQALRDSESKNYDNTEDYFSAPDIMSVNIPNANSNAQLGNMFNNLDNKPQQFESLVDFNAQHKSVKENDTNVINNNLENSLGQTLLNEQININNNSIDIKEMIDKIRNTIKDLEASGAKIDTDEMNFENQYQILIKIEK